MLLASLKRRWCVQRHRGSWRKPLRVLVCVAHLAHLKLLLLQRTTWKTSWNLTWTHSLHHKDTARDSGDEGAGVSVSQTVWDPLSRVQQLNPPGLHANEEHPKLPHAWRDTINNYQHDDACSACWWKTQQSCSFTFSCWCHDRHMYQPHTWAKDWLMLQEKKVRKM